MASFFSRITRYVPTEFQDPRENRLTEITAATLERVPGLAFEFARTLLGEKLPSWIDEETRCRVETQVHVANERGRGFVDLLLSFEVSRADVVDEFDLLVEVKHGSPESGNQLDFYSSSMAELPSRASELVVLAGREFGETAELTDGTNVKVVHWQQLTNALRASDFRGKENSWLLREYLNYLEEEKLMAIGPLDLDAAMFAALYPRANESLNELHRIALKKVCDWGPLVHNWGGYAETSVGPGRRHDFTTGGHEVSNWDSDVVFEFQFLPEDDPGNGRPSLAFFAGAWFGKKAAKPSDEWFTKMSDSGVIRYPAGGELYAMGVKYPAELLEYRSIEEQGLAVGEWALGIFEILRANPPGVAAQ